MKAGTSTHVTISKVQLQKYRDADIHDNYEQKLFLHKIRPIPNIVLKPDFHTDSVRYQIYTTVQQVCQARKINFLKH